jgi:hypothetical protein
MFKDMAPHMQVQYWKRRLQHALKFNKSYDMNLKKKMAGFYSHMSIYGAQFCYGDVLTSQKKDLLLEELKPQLYTNVTVSVSVALLGVTVRSTRTQIVRIFIRM